MQAYEIQEGSFYAVKRKGRLIPVEVLEVELETELMAEGLGVKVTRWYLCKDLTTPGKRFYVHNPKQFQSSWPVCLSMVQEVPHV